VVRAAQHAGELDLTEARGVDRRGGRSVDRRIGEDDLGGRARAVADDQRLRSVAGAGEALVVRRCPPVVDLDPVRPQARPVVAPAVVAELGDRRHQERQPGRRRRRVLHDEEVGVGRIGQRGDVGGWFEAVLVEPGDVVVDAHVAEVDGCRRTVGHEGAQLVRDGVEAFGLVGLEHLLVDDPRQERVVDAEHHVALGLARGEHGLGHHRSRVAGGHQLDGDARLVGEGVERLVQRGARLGERVVRHERDGRRVVVTARREDRRRGEQDGGEGTPGHDAAPGTITVTTPCSTETVAGGAATWLLTPRPTIGGSV
jgi:hypothetical protein